MPVLKPMPVPRLMPTVKLIPDILYHNDVDEAHTMSGVVKADRIAVDVMFENRLGEPTVRFVTSPGGDSLLARQDLIVSYDEISRVFGRFDPDAIGYCKFVNMYDELSSVVPCEEVRLVREAAAAPARRVGAMKADVASHKHAVKGGEKTRMRPWEPGYDKRRAEAEALGLRDASLYYSDDSDTSSESEDEEYKPAKKKSKTSNRAAPAAASGSSSAAAIDLCSSDDDA